MDALQRARTLIQQWNAPDTLREQGEATMDNEAMIGGEISEISEIRTSADAAVVTLRLWCDKGVLDRLPDPIPGFGDELAQYSDRACLIGLAKAILDAAMWSLTAQERAVQFVAVLTPLIEGGATERNRKDEGRV